jgi:hypothetical protein
MDNADNKNADNKNTAQNMITLHGLRAQAVVNEKLAEARAQGDAAGLERWQAVLAAVAELRTTAPAQQA